MARKISKDNMFFGLDLTEEQKEFRDAIYSDDHDIVFCNSVSGTGKTVISVATARLLVSENKYDSMIYVISPVQQSTNGFLPGTIAEKESVYYQPLFDALIKIGEQPDKCIKQYCIEGKKNSNYWIDTMSHVYTRGINLHNKVIVIEESQNYKSDELKRILTRISDSCKTIVIGHDKQIDLKNPSESGFVRYVDHFANKKRCKICNLTVNFRGWVSSHADALTL
jgi:phosphate starvation-inducible protein PhoH